MQGTYCVYVFDEEDEEYEIEIAWSVFGSYEPARTMGPPERCYPAQYPDCDYDSITLHEFGRIYHLQLEEVLEVASSGAGVRVTEEDIEIAVFEMAAEAEADACEYAMECRAEEMRDRYHD